MHVHVSDHDWTDRIILFAINFAEDCYAYRLHPVVEKIKKSQTQTH